MYNKNNTNTILAIILGVFAFVIVIIGLMFGIPQYRVWSAGLAGEASLRRAEQDRQILIEEAKAKLEAEKLMAQAEVERAKGAFEANKILASSFGDVENYLHYLWINNLSQTQNKVIYIPTETGLPILEAGKADQK